MRYIFTIHQTVEFTHTINAENEAAARAQWERTPVADYNGNENLLSNMIVRVVAGDIAGPWTGKRIRTLRHDCNEVELNAGIICPDCNGPKHSHTDDCKHWLCNNEQTVEHACGMAMVDIPVGWTATVGERVGHDYGMGDMYAVNWDDNPAAANPDRTTSNMGWCIWGERELERYAEIIEEETK